MLYDAAMRRLCIVFVFFGALVSASGTSIGLAYNIAKALMVLPEPWRGEVQTRVQANCENFSRELTALLENTDPDLLLLVDKEHALLDDYVPDDLVFLDAGKAVLNKKDMQARRAAAEALYAMIKAAKAEGITLSVSSAYRSYHYQAGLFNRYVQELGEAEASRVSAKPGHSQHQLGTAFDFGSVTNEFAVSRAGVWMEKHAGAYGFSLSYPQRLESLTGYSWESWHFRYISVPAVRLQNAYFLGIQQLMLMFVHAYQHG